MCPLSRSAIPLAKLSKAVPHVVKPVTTEPQAAEEQPAEQQAKPTEIVVHLSGECTVNNTVTPLRLHLRGYFTDVLQRNRKTRSCKVDNRKVKPSFMVKH